MTKRDLYELAMKLIGLFSAVKFVYKIPELLNVIISLRALPLTHVTTVIATSTTLALMAGVLIFRGTAIADYLAREYNIHGGTDQSSIAPKSLLLLALKVLGLYCIINAFALGEMKFFLFVFGCILAFGSRYVARLLYDDHFKKAFSRLEKTRTSGEKQAAVTDIQDLLFLSVKVLGMYCFLNALMEERFAFLIIGCILVFGTKQIVNAISEENISKVVAKAGLSPDSQKASSSVIHDPIHRQDLRTVPANRSQADNDARLTSTNAGVQEQIKDASSDRKTTENRSFGASPVAASQQQARTVITDSRPADAEQPSPVQPAAGKVFPKQPDKKADQRKKGGFFGDIFGKTR